MNAAFFVMVLAAFVYAALHGNISALGSAAMQAGSDAWQTALSMLGGFMFFGGIIKLLERAGAVNALVRYLKRPLKKLFGAEVSDAALGAVAMNLSANMLGMGNAATPMGLRAARLLQPQNQTRASAALCMLLVLNATSVQVYPSTVVALRYAAGSADPERIVLPTLLASAASTLVGVLCCFFAERKRR